MSVKELQTSAISKSHTHTHTKMRTRGGMQVIYVSSKFVIPAQAPLQHSQAEFDQFDQHWKSLDTFLRLSFAIGVSPEYKKKQRSLHN